MERILIVRLGAMGDVLHALPAVAALRRSFPAARLGWVIEERWSELLSARESRQQPAGSPDKPLVDVLHPVDTRAWRTAPFSDETWRELSAAVRELRASRYDSAVDFQGLLKSAFVARLSGAPARLGFDDPRERLSALLYTRRVPRRGSHVIEQNLGLAAAAGADTSGPPEFPLPADPSVERWCTEELRHRGISRFALLSPGGGWGAKLWPASRYGEVARALAEDGLASLVNFGPGEEGLVQAVEQASGGAASGLRSSLAELVAVTRRADICIGGDTGPTHLAAALDRPVVALFGPTDPARNRPWGTKVAVLRHAASSTSYQHHSRPDAGLAAIPAAEVTETARRLLEKPS